MLFKYIIVYTIAVVNDFFGTLDFFGPIRKDAFTVGRFADIKGSGAIGVW